MEPQAPRCPTPLAVAFRAGVRALAGALLLSAAMPCLPGPSPAPPPDPPGNPWDWHLKAPAPASSPALRARPLSTSLGAGRGGSPWKGSAVVEIWGNVSPVDTAAFKDFKRILYPALVQASWTGHAMRENALQLTEFMALGDKYRTPTAGNFWYNCLRPSSFEPAVKPDWKIWELLKERDSRGRE